MECLTKFGEVQKQYEKFRPEYPEQLFELIMRNTSCPHLKFVDLGAGTGISTKELSKYFKTAYAVEPDAAMIDNVAFQGNVQIVNCLAEEFNAEDNEIDLVTSGNAFYWMNGDKVVEKVAGWLRNGGLFAVYRYNIPTVHNKVQEIIDKELAANWNRFRHERLVDTEYSIRTITQANLFSKIQLIQVENIIKMSAENFVGFLTSTSYCSAYINTIDDKDRYVQNLIDSIKAAVNEDIIEVDFSIELILAIK